MNSEDPLFLLYTSGSTGNPKGVLHTTGGLSATAELIVKCLCSSSIPFLSTCKLSPYAAILTQDGLHILLYSIVVLLCANGIQVFRCQLLFSVCDVTSKSHVVYCTSLYADLQSVLRFAAVCTSVYAAY